MVCRLCWGLRFRLRWLRLERCRACLVWWRVSVTHQTFQGPHRRPERARRRPEDPWHLWRDEGGEG